MAKAKTPFICHKGPVEIIPGLFLGGYKDSMKMITKNKVHTLVPLDSMSPEAWEEGFRGQVLYVPVEDYGVLPRDVESNLVTEIIKQLKRRKRVGLYCLGGHGRTGYIAGVILGRKGYKDPIKKLRTDYCVNAVETNEQIERISIAANNPELIDKYKIIEHKFFRYNEWDFYKDK